MQLIIASAVAASLAFTSDRDGDREIFVMRSDGGAQTQLTHNATADNGPEWSPDGRRLEYATDGGFAVITAGGKPVGTFTGAWSPTWAPDGRRLAYLRPTGMFRDMDLFVAHADGTGEVQLTHEAERQWAPDWSPDGSRIALSWGSEAGQIPHDANVVVINADGSGRTQLTHVPQDFSGGGALVPTWSPDGRRIAFTLDGDSDEVRLVNADGTGERRLTDSPLDESHQTWSPDGTRIALTRDLGGRFGIVVKHVDGSGERVLSPTAYNDFGPVWSPDGSEIAFTSDRDGDDEVFVMDADGGNVRQLTSNAADDVVGSWTDPPRPRAVAISRRRVRLRRGAVAVRLRCPAAARVPCAGRLTLRRRKVPLASARFRIAPGATVAVKVRLARQARRTLRRVAPTRIAAVVRAPGLPAKTATFVVRASRL